MGLPSVNSPVLFDYSEQLAILLFGQLMKWLRPMVRRGDSIPLADLRDALWAVKEAWELHRDIARASGPQHLTEVPAEELEALTAGYDPLIEARELSVADKRRLQVYLAQRGQVAEAEAAKKQLAGDSASLANGTPRPLRAPESLHRRSLDSSSRLSRFARSSGITSRPCRCGRSTAAPAGHP
jgi:hypothetical protein